MFELALGREEWVSEHYIDIKGPLKEALLLEELGKVEDSANQYRAAFAEDIQTAMLVLRIRSQPSRPRCALRRGRGRGAQRAERAQHGEKVKHYVTAKGEDRELQPMTGRR
jgi:hypothetical protein